MPFDVRDIPPDSWWSADSGVRNSGVGLPVELKLSDSWIHNGWIASAHDRERHERSLGIEGVDEWLSLSSCHPRWLLTLFRWRGIVLEVPSHSRAPDWVVTVVDHYGAACCLSEWCKEAEEADH